MMNLGLNLKGIILAWSQLETSLGAVTRIKNFEETTPSELLPEENYVPPEEWPSRGSIDFVSLSVQYECVILFPPPPPPPPHIPEEKS
jgi:hypothetical protein